MAKRIPHEELAKSAWAVHKLGWIVAIILTFMAIGGKSIVVGAFALMWVFLCGPLADALATLARIGSNIDLQVNGPRSDDE